jgi:hypothetical protein
MANNYRIAGTFAREFAFPTFFYGGSFFTPAALTPADNTGQSVSIVNGRSERVCVHDFGGDPC